MKDLKNKLESGGIWKNSDGDVDKITTIRRVYASFEEAMLLKQHGFAVTTRTVYQHNKSIYDCVLKDSYPHLKSNDGRTVEYYFMGEADWNSVECAEDQYFYFANSFNESSDESFTIACTAPERWMVLEWIWLMYGIHVLLYVTQGGEYKILRSRLYATSPAFASAEEAYSWAVSRILTTQNKDKLMLI